MEGYIRLWRSIADSPVWTCSTANQKVVLITILLHVRWNSIRWDVLGKEFTIGPGEIFTSIRKLADMAGVTQRVVRTALDRFESVNFLTRKVTHQGMLISVVNWDKYQGLCDLGDTPGDTKKTRRGHTHDTPNSKNDTTIRKKVLQEGKEGKEGKKVIPPISPKGGKGGVVPLFEKFSGGNQELLSALKEWHEMRKRMKKPLTEKAAELNLKDLQKLSDGDERQMAAIVLQSIKHGWQGFYVLKEAQTPRAAPQSSQNMEDFIDGLEQFKSSLPTDNSHWDA